MKDLGSNHETQPSAIFGRVNGTQNCGSYNLKVRKNPQKSETSDKPLLYHIATPLRMTPLCY